MGEDQSKAVLVVEDEAFIRMTAVDTLGDMGMESYEAADASEALELLEDHPDISLIFTDINMPGPIDGLALVEEAHRRRPAVDILVTSGATILDEAALPDHGTFLPKPYSSDQLMQAVRQKLPK